MKSTSHRACLGAARYRQRETGGRYQARYFVGGRGTSKASTSAEGRMQNGDLETLGLGYLEQEDRTCMVLNLKWVWSESGLANA